MDSFYFRHSWILLHIVMELVATLNIVSINKRTSITTPPIIISLSGDLMDLPHKLPQRKCMGKTHVKGF